MRVDDAIAYCQHNPDMLTAGCTEFRLICLLDSCLYRLVEEHDWTTQRLRQAVEAKIDGHDLMHIYEGGNIIKDALGK